MLKPGGVLVMSDVSAERSPRTAPEAVAGLANLRAWGIRRRSLMSADAIEAALLVAGFTRIELRDVSDRVFAPAIRFYASACGAPQTPRSSTGEAPACC